MHEYGIAKNIIDTLKEIRTRYPKKSIKTATIVTGQLQQVIPESMLFYLEILTQDTEFSNTKFLFKENPIKIRCNKCAQEIKIEDFNIICPLCGSNDVEIIGGNEIFIESIEIDDS